MQQVANICLKIDTEVTILLPEDTRGSNTRAMNMWDFPKIKNILACTFRIAKPVHESRRERRGRKKEERLSRGGKENVKKINLSPCVHE